MRAFIPGLYGQNLRPGEVQRRSPTLTQEEQAIFYEKGMRPTLIDLLKSKGRDLPSTYGGEMWRAQPKNSRKLGFQSRPLTAIDSSRFGQLLRANLQRNGVPWHDGIVFLHQVRGVKFATGHEPDDEETAKDAMNAFYYEFGIDGEKVDSDHTYFDIGLEVTSTDEQCLAFRTDSHYNFMVDILGISEAEALRLSSIGSSKYSRDLTSLLVEIAGCRIRDVGGPDLIRYLQLYLTDKGLTYLMDGGHTGKYVTAHDLLTKDMTTYLQGLYSTYCNAIESSSSNARAEVRVPLSQATSVFVGLDPELFRLYLISVSRSVWWYVAHPNLFLIFH